MIMTIAPPYLLHWFSLPENREFHRTIDTRTKLVCPKSNHHQFFYIALVNQDPAWVTKCKNCMSFLRDPVRMPDGELKLTTVRANGSGSSLGKD